MTLNVTITDAEGPGFATVYPCDGERPWASNLNFGRGDTVPNAVFAKLAADGSVCVYVSETAHVVLDVNGVVIPIPG